MIYVMENNLDSYNIVLIDNEGNKIIANQVKYIFALLKDYLKNDNIEDSDVSLTSLIVDIYSLNEFTQFFYNYQLDLKHNKFFERTQNQLYIIFAVVLSESLDYFIKDDKTIFQNNIEFYKSYKQLKELRKEIKQYEFRTFTKTIDEISTQMGRKNDISEPALDMVIYINSDKNNMFYGTNINLFRSIELKNNEVFQNLNVVLSTLTNLFNVEKNEDVIEIKKEKNPITRYSYSFTDIIKKNEGFSENEINRLISAIDALASTHEFFTCIVSVDEYLKGFPHMIYFIRKILSIILDETFDNLNNYIEFSKTPEKKATFKSIIKDVESEFIEECKLLRNNIHYRNQSQIEIGNVEYSYNQLFEMLSVVETLIKNINDNLYINTKKSKLYYYKILAWLQNRT